MIAHVASSAENRGRVLVLLQSGRPSSAAVSAAARFAEAHQAAIETLFVADRRLFDAVRHAQAPAKVALAIGASGRAAAALDGEALAYDLAASARFAAVEMGRTAAARGVPVSHGVMTGEAIAAVAEACTAIGPWNVVVDTAPLTAGAAARVSRLLREVTGSTGLVVAGPLSVVRSGPIVVVGEDAGDLPPLLRTAQRLAAHGDGAISVLLLGRSAFALEEMEGLARLALAENGLGGDVEFVAKRVAHPAAAAEALRQVRAGFVVARHGGMLVPMEADFGALIAALEAPLLLVR
jgi:hypothetical protein